MNCLAEDVSDSLFNSAFNSSVKIGFGVSNVLVVDTAISAVAVIMSEVSSGMSSPVFAVAAVEVAAVISSVKIGFTFTFKFELVILLEARLVGFIYFVGKVTCGSEVGV